MCCILPQYTTVLSFSRRGIAHNLNPPSAGTPSQRRSYRLFLTMAGKARAASVPESDGVTNVGSLAAALPAASRAPFKRRSRKSREANDAGGAGSMPKALPPCFAEVWRRRSSNLEVHRNERAALEAVAATIPADTRDSADSKSAAAGLYLAALVLALKRVVETSRPSLSASGVKFEDGKQAISKRQRQKARKRAAEKDAIAAADEMHASATNSKNRMQDSDQMEGNAGVDDAADVTSGEIGLMSSLVYLVSLALQDASPALVNARFEDILEAVAGSVNHSGGAAVVSRHAAAAIAGTLALVNPTAWTKPCVQRAYLRLVTLASDADPKTRRRGREALQSLIDGPRGTLVVARTSGAVAAHLVSMLRDLHVQLDKNIDVDTTAEAGHSIPTRLIHVITCITVLIPSFRPGDASTVAKELIVLAAMNLPHVTVFAFNVLSAMFDMREVVQNRTSHEDSGGEEEGEGESLDGSGKKKASQLRSNRTVIPTASLGKMVLAVSELTVPTDAQEEAVVAFASCLSAAAVTYFEAHAFSSPPAGTMSATVNALVECLDPVVARPSSAPKLARSLQNVISQKWLQGKPDVFAALEPLFGYRFKAIWSDALSPLRRYLEQEGCAGSLHMHVCISSFVKRVVKVREQALNAKDRRTQGVTNSILASTLRGGGVASVLEAVPLGRDSKLLLTNAWILPPLHEHVRRSPLSFLSSELLPLAGELSSLALEARDGGRAVEATNANMLAAQLWDLLPAFCQIPSDLSQDAALNSVFAAFAKCVEAGTSIGMRQSGVGGLRSLSDSVAALPEDASGTASTRKLFSKNLKKLFPALTRLVEQTAPDRRGPVLEAITKAVAACGDAKLAANLLRKSVRRLLEASVGDVEQHGENEDDGGTRGTISEAMTDGESAAVIRHAAADVSIAIAESGAIPKDCTEIDFLERAMSPLFLDPSDTALQKKAYRATTLLVALGVIGQDLEASMSFVENTATAAGSVATSAKGTRLGLIQALIELSRNQPLQLLEVCTTSFLPEIIIGTRDVSEKTRAASFSALSALTRTWYQAGGEQADGLRQFLVRLAAGLAGRTVTMLAATLTSITHVVYEFRAEASVYADFASDVDSLFAVSLAEGNNGDDENDQEMVGDTNGEGGRGTSTGQVLEPGPVTILLRHSSREVQKAALGTIKMATSALSRPQTRLIRILPAILPGLVSVAAKSKKKETRLRVRVILERLLRKCGREVVESVFPAEHTKLLAAVRKQYSRELTKKHESREKKRALKEADDAAAAQSSRLDGGSGDENSDEGSDVDDDVSLDNSDSDIEAEILDGDELATRPVKKSIGPLLVEDGEKVVDLLDTRMADGFSTGEVANASKRAHSEQKRNRGKAGYDVGDDGRPIFKDDSDDESGGAEHGSDDNDGGGRDDEKHAKSAKRKRGGLESGRAKKMKGSFGAEYRSRRGAAGDMKKPGVPDPYAYVPIGAGVSDASRALIGRNSTKKASRGKTGRRASKMGGRGGVPARR